MDKSVFTNEEVTDITHMLKVICKPNRLLLLEKIIEGVQCNRELGNELNLAPNLVSHHLSVLHEVGLIESERDPVDARWIYFSINVNVMEDLRRFFNEFFETNRIQPRQSSCNPLSTYDRNTKV